MHSTQFRDHFKTFQDALAAAAPQELLLLDSQLQALARWHQQRPFDLNALLPGLIPPHKQ
ncbi:MAG: hypothetical protein IPK79_10475 [Vampirovibrionales bacterium]|nr:hypothetical protein [Vampirovibrionales bacterium]